jgi:hypothetical protein
MLEGGNVQLSTFFDRHGMGCGANNNEGNNKVQGLDRYNTKAASFYRQHLMSHARDLAKKDGLYQGREASRKKSCSGGSTKKKGGGASPGKSGKSRKKPREGSTSGSKNKQTLPTVAEKELVEQQTCETIET